MKISQNGLDALVKLLNNVLSGSAITSVMTISNTQYSGQYLEIFVDEAEKNNNEAIGYDDFSAELWIRLARDANNHPREADEFMRTWNAWADLYRYMNRKGKIK